MKKKVITIIIVIVVLLVTGLIFYGTSKINDIKRSFDDAHSSTLTIPKSTTTTKRTRTTTTTKAREIDVESLLKDVKREKGKVNIYFFYGEGCPHCELEHKVFAEIKDKYGKYYNLYEFEIWYNNENRALGHLFAKSMNTELSGVPFTVIGNQYMTGFGSESKNTLIEKIEEEKDKGYDLYFDVIKKQ